MLLRCRSVFRYPLVVFFDQVMTAREAFATSPIGHTVRQQQKERGISTQDVPLGVAGSGCGGVKREALEDVSEPGFAAGSR